MKIVIDVNLSVHWVSTLKKEGFEAIHWRNIGKSTAPDEEIMEWARQNGYVVFTQDLDFGTLLALSGQNSPSIFQLRTENSLPQYSAHLVLNALKQFADILTQGALVTVNENKIRAKVLPFKKY
ncbi:MAG: hypothetical protein GY862_23535 [Gammaproteobacteria bacterium]|nr:hypothetical protein [Gammaproteobacteria bacterium]